MDSGNKIINRGLEGGKKMEGIKRILRYDVI